MDQTDFLRAVEGQRKGAVREGTQQVASRPAMPALLARGAKAPSRWQSTTGYGQLNQVRSWSCRRSRFGITRSLPNTNTDDRGISNPRRHAEAAQSVIESAALSYR